MIAKGAPPTVATNQLLVQSVGSRLLRHVLVALPTRFQRHEINYTAPMLYNERLNSNLPYIPVAEARGLRAKSAKFYVS
jgi:hypothetical protein